MGEKAQITVQLGHHSNYVGTHFWNTQEAYYQENLIEHSVLFRSGENLNGEETFTPRLVALDLKGSLLNLDKNSQLYEPHTPYDSWSGEITTINQQTPPQNEFLQSLANNTHTHQSYSTQLTAKCNSWSDFNISYYHPKTVLELNAYSHDDAERRFDSFVQGTAVASDTDFWDELLENRLRFFIEEADRLDGFNILSDTNTGFSGVTAELLQYLRDEIPKTSIIVYGVNPPPLQKKSFVHSVNSAFSMNAYAGMADVYVPLWDHGKFDHKFPYFNVDVNLPYHWSSILSSAIETISLPTRLKNSPVDMYTLCNTLNNSGKTPISGLSTSLPFPLHCNYDENGTLINGVSKEEWSKVAQTVDEWMCDLTLDEFTIEKEEFGQLSVLRGVSNSTSQSFLNTQSTLEFLDTLLATQTPLNCSKNIVLDTVYPLTNTFPQLFNRRLTKAGRVLRKASLQHDVVESIPILSRLYTGKRVGKLVEMNYQVLGKEGLSDRKVGRDALRVFEDGFTREELMEVGERLMELGEGYDD